MCRIDLSSVSRLLDLCIEHGGGVPLVVAVHDEVRDASGRPQVRQHRTDQVELGGRDGHLGSPRPVRIETLASDLTLRSAASVRPAAPSVAGSAPRAA